ncbi:MAG: ABC transporter ATP-binding protein [Chitinophagales bacterium]|nr:ABC transporter ATP-binding protein [Chitinophagales bacterium]
MKNTIALSVNNITKQYIIPDVENRKKNTFYALKDISFTVERGDVVSIIGNNGSGKTTLLKILSGITKPSSGEIYLYGSTTSILDIGSNFHPDLTGAENVRLQLKYFKKSKAEIETASQNILDFSEIGEFYYRPVKHYSNGMFLRLAFSLAFHSYADIMILDEVLSVGDEGFRLKCQELLKTLSASGRTIIFVSHNRTEILELSNKCLWIEKGELKKTGQPAALLGEYFIRQKDNFDGKKEMVEIKSTDLNKLGTVDLQWNKANCPQNKFIAIKAISILNLKRTSEKLINTDPIEIILKLEKKIQGAKIGITFFVENIFYQPVLVGHLLNNTEGRDLSEQFKEYIGEIKVDCRIPEHFLIPGKYYMHLRLGVEENEWNNESKELIRFSEELSFIIHPQSDYIDLIGDINKGSVRPKLEWNIYKVPSLG